MQAANENLTPKVIKELARELRTLDESPPEGIRVYLNDDNFANIHAEIDGPAGTPYEGGLFKMKLVLPHDFPTSPPKGYFLTRIFHPNIAKNGEICVNTLKKDWKSNLGLTHVLLVVRCLLIEPFPESALNEEAGKMLMEDYVGYAKHARLMTSIHAMKPSKARNKITVAEALSAPAAMAVAAAPLTPSLLPTSAESNAVAHPQAPLALPIAKADGTDGSQQHLSAVAMGFGVEGASVALVASPSAKKSKGGEPTAKLADRRRNDKRRGLKRL
ncbi:hypothetical protein CBR_g12172 [Chara braunii]|uniref:E2 ubiquitin-conjugating enzyme n=1 Tax=Chara braunii TaxID=69332 RepID=A0A388KRE1_CHABU|nr:hypothetical protein CBR_g12172 [Chara braunii]|eukprot:GBG72599.1 hypothetical protein CBR_g12172 [Chara braunii]